MRYLLDTSTFLWIALNSPKLSAKCRDAFADAESEVFLSSVSAWEIVVKHANKRLPLPDSPQTFVPRLRETHGIQTLPLTEEAVLHVSRLPFLHKDPFDRMLICQAIAHGLAILTPDPLIGQYPVRVLW